MAKLYFRYGTMDSAKTLQLLAVAHNYRKQGRAVLLVKPALDDRFGTQTIRSRSGLEAPADLLVDDASTLPLERFDGLDCVLVDEAQFLSPHIVEGLREVTRSHEVPVICYGLRTDFRGALFPGSRRLLELADTIEEVKVTCQYCTRKAIMNLRLAPNGEALATGPQVELGADERYVPACYACWRERLLPAREAAGLTGLWD
ncbi:MAG: thymidine kinase [Myxococcota bacterium]